VSSAEPVWAGGRERAVADLLGGSPPAVALPVVDHDPAKEWEPRLRDRILPSVSVAPRVRIGRLAVDGVEGAAAPAEYWEAIRNEYGWLRLCYAKGLSEAPTLEGRVFMTLKIGADGVPGEAKLESESTLRDPGMTACLRRVIGRVRFPASEHGVNIEWAIQFEAG
jgi:hypothetical protein